MTTEKTVHETFPVTLRLAYSGDDKKLNRLNGVVIELADLTHEKFVRALVKAGVPDFVRPEADVDEVRRGGTIEVNLVDARE
mgnify:CR=1 FL=1